jgi:hypothetical protein
MTQRSNGIAGRDIRVLNSSLAQAGDAQIARVVALVDAMPERGGADALIAPLRKRLGQLRPARPLRFTRLLFHPLDPLIVPAPRWRPGRPTLSRATLPALANTVRAGLGAEAVRIDALIEGCTTQHTARLRQAGALLWPRAAEILAAAPAPLGWADTGLNEALYPPLAWRVSALLSQVAVLHELIDETATGIAPLRPAPVRAMLEAVSAASPDGLAMLLALLLARLPPVAALLPAIAASLGPEADAALQLATAQASETLLQHLGAADGTELPVASADLARSASEVRRIAALLRALAEGEAGVERHDRLQAIRQRLDASCRHRFAHGITVEFLGPLQSLAAQPDDAAADRLEDTARHLRELETEARALGGGETYDALLGQAAMAVGRVGSTLGIAGQVRLVEILAGPDAALDLLGSR